MALLKQEAVTEIILDHDLGDDTHGTSHDVTLWIEEAVTTKITATFSENNINCFLYG
ncbi:cyclic-phosphate processing receiver domain-containing protein [Vibrio vulnificus]|uniref:cyclic-phosphate processing receiver domain-containing protein n=1 Tax=Vibrio vulnificus TaxID=672 RepID=UPI002B46B0C5|nr:cyclic-phosphate processing receiver domain-containing protein [Vibrio vulnificus]